MKYLIGLLLIIFTSCSDQKKIAYFCTCQEKEKAAAFIERSIKPANNMSDEEMEDVIMQLYKTSVVMFCHQQHVLANSQGEVYRDKIKVDSCNTFTNIAP